MIDISLIFLAGLFASVHCVGMCGPIVMAYSTYGAADAASHAGKNVKNLFYFHLAYNGGRILSYMLLGGIIGLTGMALGEIKSIGRLISIAGGSFIIIFGIAILLNYSFSLSFAFSDRFKKIKKVQAALLSRQNIKGKFLLGLLTPLIPCGILYAMLLKAMASGSSLNGAITMGVFGAGMALPLMLVGSLSTLISTGLRKRANQFSAVIIIIMGVLILFRGLEVHYLSWLPGSEKKCQCGHQ